MFFGSRLHDPNAPWRSEPASERQLERLKELGVRYRPGITKGEAGDLISRQRSPDEDEIEFLKFFGVKEPEKLSQHGARQEIARIVADEANRQRWDNRPASDEQRRLIAHVEGSAPKGLKAEVAAKMISSYLDDEQRAAKVEEFWDLEATRQDREDAISWLTEDIQELASEYRLRSVSRRDVRQAVEELEAETGAKIEDLEPEDVAERIRRNRPEKVREVQKPVRSRSRARVREKPGASFTGWLGLILIAWILYSMMFS